MGTADASHATPDVAELPVLLVFDQVNAYGTRLLDGIRSVLVPAGIPLIVYVNDPLARDLRIPIRRLLCAPDVRGVISTILTDDRSQLELSRALAESALPAVHIGAESTHGWSVGVDNATGMRAMMRHILDEVGATRVALVRGLDHHPDALERESVVRAELLARGLALDPELVLEGRFDRDTAFHSTAQMLRQSPAPDAIVALNDRSALGVLDAVTAAGLRVPRDVIITGFDDEDLARECDPPLTTVSQELFAQGARAAGLLLEQLGGAAPRGHVTHPAALVVRDSTRQSDGDRTHESCTLVRHAHALAAMDRGLSINRAFMACRTVPELVAELAANLLRLGLDRCFLVLNTREDDSRASVGVVVLEHDNDRTVLNCASEEFSLDDVLPRALRHQLGKGCLTLQPLSADGADLGYVLFEQATPDRFVGEFLRMDLSKAIDSLQRAERNARSLESLVALRTAELNAEVSTRTEAERQLRQANRELRGAQAQLVDSARQAGMAEIATNVLHNVGNVLNSITVSADLACQKVRGSKASGLARAVAMMQEHDADLGDYLTLDARGKQLPGYLATLAATLTAERASIEDELHRLTKGVVHIREIVSAQQSLAGVSGVIESVRVSELVDDALQMAGVLDHESVMVVRSFPDDPLLSLDRHRVLLVLLNLVSNAVQAMAPDGSPRKLSVNADVADGQVRITVIDSGVGILPENLTRVFVHGFTTHSDGHGFGLHSSAVAAREMGGSLSVHSDGPGTGAVFTLAIPLQVPRDLALVAV